MTTKIYNTKEAAEMLRVSKRTLARYREDGRISYSQYKRKVLFTQDDLSKFLLANKQPTFQESQKSKKLYEKLY